MLRVGEGTTGHWDLGGKRGVLGSGLKGGRDFPPPPPKSNTLLGGCWEKVKENGGFVPKNCRGNGAGRALHHLPEPGACGGAGTRSPPIPGGGRGIPGAPAALPALPKLRGPPFPPIPPGSALGDSPWATPTRPSPRRCRRCRWAVAEAPGEFNSPRSGAPGAPNRLDRLGMTPDGAGCRGWGGGLG